MHVKALGKLKRPAQILNAHIKNRYLPFLNAGQP